MIVRRGTADDVGPAADTLALAFTGYVWSDWTIEADGQEKRLRRGFDLILRHAIVPYAELWVTDDCAAAAIWTPPNADARLGAAFRAIAAELDEVAGDRAAANDAAEAQVARLRPAAPYWYLASVGTRPERQREGLGGAVLAPVLARGERAYLETSAEDNLRFYERLGFAVVAETVIDGGGPPVWGMLRP